MRRAGAVIQGVNGSVRIGDIPLFTKEVDATSRR